MQIDWNIILSAVTTVVAVIALLLSGYQIRLSNKQHLFDKRVENYIIAKGLIELYKENTTFFQKKDDEIFSDIDSRFIWLTNNSYLESITSAIHYPLEEQFQKTLLLKLENLKEVATKTTFLFDGKSSELLGNFILHYQKLLFAMYQYQILFTKMQKKAKEDKLSKEEASEQLNEKEQRNKLYKAISNVTKSYSELMDSNVEEKIKSQIRR